MTTDPPISHTERERDLPALLSEWLEVRAEIARLEARSAEILAGALEGTVGADGVTNEADDIAVRSMAAEFAAASRVPQRTVEGMVYEAHDLVTKYPQTHRALAAGEISARHAREVQRVILPVDATDTDMARFESAALERARTATAAQLRPYVRMLAQKVFPQDLHARHKQARETRTVRAVDQHDGMSDLIITAPAVLVHATFDRLTQMGHAVGDAAFDTTGTRDPRTLSQVRADLAIDLLLASDATSVTETSLQTIRPTVQVTIPARTLSGAGSAPAELAGYGEIDPALVRELAGLAAGWERLLIDPVTEAVTHTDTYRPTNPMRRHLRIRDQHCRFPGCRAPVNRCDLDHSHEYSRGGPTATSNLAHLCRGHHALKHPDLADHHRWHVTQTKHGVLEWTSPSGRTYIDKPPPRVIFT